MANEVRRTAIQSFKDPSHIGGQIVHSYAVERAAALSSATHVDTDGLQPTGSEHARQSLKITAATPGIRQQHNWSTGPVKGAFERRAADFDVSVLLQSHLRAYPRPCLPAIATRLPLISGAAFCELASVRYLKRREAGDHRPSYC